MFIFQTQRFNISNDQLAKFQDAFNKFDKNGDGKISIQELEEAIVNMGRRITKAKLKHMIETVDKDGKEIQQLSNY